MNEYIQHKVPIKINDIEVKNKENIPSYTLVKMFEENYPQFTFYLIIGSDLLSSLKN